MQIKTIAMSALILSTLAFAGCDKKAPTPVEAPVATEAAAPAATEAPAPAPATTEAPAATEAAPAE